MTPALALQQPEFSVRIATAPITTNHAYAPVAFKLKGMSKWVARIRLTAEGEAWREHIHDQVLRGREVAAPRWQLAGVYEVAIVYTFSSPLSDIDGPIKLTLDALQGVVYNNDRQIAHLDVWRRVDREHPGVEITVRELAGGRPQQGALPL